jgi:hypothetical protein
VELNILYIFSQIDNVNVAVVMMILLKVVQVRKIVPMFLIVTKIKENIVMLKFRALHLRLTPPIYRL